MAFEWGAFLGNIALGIGAGLLFGYLIYKFRTVYHTRKFTEKALKQLRGKKFKIEGQEYSIDKHLENPEKNGLLGKPVKPQKTKKFSPEGAKTLKLPQKKLTAKKITKKKIIPKSKKKGGTRK
ncbi:hypothetical protein LCGC14_2033980 [marine sediment metagenome]|uniref:Uncharacterized protein n=1 Tax=marine sediment metagenome TaxID=412755 RepID=A0A0F9H7B7_9ZZZZ